jgi:hypothetical protein
MKYIVSWMLPQETFHTAATRFLKTGGVPQTGVKVVGYWHGVSGRGFAVVETTNERALHAWVAECSDLLPPHGCSSAYGMELFKRARAFEWNVASDFLPAVLIR